MRTITEFKKRLLNELPQTYTQLTNGHLLIHDVVKRITLHGSRGLNGRPRPDSDIDLALVLDTEQLKKHPDQNRLLKEVLELTLREWRGKDELDIAAVFDRSGCGLRCLATERYTFDGCQKTSGCMGVYKIQRGFDGYVKPEDVDCRKMQPVMIIWEDEK